VLARLHLGKLIPCPIALWEGLETELCESIQAAVNALCDGNKVCWIGELHETEAAVVCDGDALQQFCAGGELLIGNA
jgi:hypothetical protein